MARVFLSKAFTFSPLIFSSLLFDSIPYSLLPFSSPEMEKNSEVVITLLPSTEITTKHLDVEKVRRKKQQKKCENMIDVRYGQKTSFRVLFSFLLVTI